MIIILIIRLASLARCRKTGCRASSASRGQACDSWHTDKHLSLSLSLYIYIYMYIYVCVCRGQACD